MKKWPKAASYYCSCCQKLKEGEYVTRSKTSNVISIEMFMDTSICNTILIAVERWQQLGCPGNTALRT